MYLHFSLHKSKSLTLFPLKDPVIFYNNYFPEGFWVSGICCACPPAFTFLFQTSYLKKLWICCFFLIFSYLQKIIPFKITFHTVMQLPLTLGNYVFIECLSLLNQKSVNSSCKKLVIILGFVGYMISATTTQFYHWNQKAAIDKT